MIQKGKYTLQWQQFWMDLIDIEKVYILNNFFKTLFHTNIKCKRRIFRFTAQQYQTAIYIPQSIKENILIAVYLSVLLLK